MYHGLDKTYQQKSNSDFITIKILKKCSFLPSTKL